MTIEKYLKTAWPLAVAGVLFAGYMTGVKFFSGACAFSEPCPTLLGLPACAYGFVIFSTMLVSTVLFLLKKNFVAKAIKINLGLSGFGILFSGYFAVPEIINLVTGQSDYMLGLPSCAYGLVFYVVIFAVTLAAWLKNRSVAAEDAAPVVEADDNGEDVEDLDFAD
jgi:uncharacterized membrane protein